MKFGLKIISIALIMLTGIGNAFAGPFGRREEGPRRQQHANQQEQKQQRQQFQQPAAQPQQQARQNPVMPPPNAGGQFSGRPSDARNPGQRMSPEDRRELRRQINEAGQDIYTQKR